MGGNKSHTIALYLIALALLEGNGRTYVSKEIREALAMFRNEIGIE